MPPRRIAAARIAAKGYKLPSVRTGAATRSSDSAPDPRLVRGAREPLENAEYQLRRAAMALQEANLGFYGDGPAGYDKALRTASITALGMAYLSVKIARQI